MLTADEALLRTCRDANLDVLFAYRDGRIEYTEDAIASLVKI